jgi:hypothetical protein
VNAKKIPVVKVGQAGVTGTPDEFEMHYARRRKGSGRSIAVQQPKLQAIKNPSMQDRIEGLGLEER